MKGGLKKSLELMKLINEDNFEKFRHELQKYPHAILTPTNPESQWSSALHFIIAQTKPWVLECVCRVLKHNSICIDSYTYYHSPLELVSYLHSTNRDESIAKAKILMEYGATQLQGTSAQGYNSNIIYPAQRTLDRKREQIGKATTTILAMCRVKKHFGTWFRIVGRDMTRLIAEEVYHSGLYLWP